MPHLDEVLAERLAALERSHRRRELRESSRPDAVTVERDGKRLVSFACNDYLGLSRHAEVKAAAASALEEYGAGGGASRLVTGNCPLYAPLETLLARRKGSEAACVFGSGFLANLGVIAALAGAGDLVLLDRLAHASLIDGARLSGARMMRFRHNDQADLERLLAAHRSGYRHCLIVTETVFSMDGDLAPLAAFARLAQAHDAWTLADDAHGLGVLRAAGAGGAGPGSMIWTGTLSKAVGAYGGYACGSRTLIDYLHNAARALVYSTALPPPVLAAAAAALGIIARDPALAAKPLAHARLFALAAGLPEPPGAIVPVMLGSEEAALAAARRLEEQGFLVPAIRPPTVPPGASRLRFSFSAMHHEEDIEAAAAEVKRLREAVCGLSVR